MPSIAHFVGVNSTMLMFGTLVHNVYVSCPVFLPFLFLLHDTTIPRFFRKNDRIESIIRIWPVSFFNSISLFLTANYFSYPAPLSFWHVLLFIPYSFVFEVLFDFFHYWSHRILHQIPFLYRLVHSRHHRTVGNIDVYTTFDHDVMDLVLTNFLPTVLTCLLCRPTTLFLCIWFIYKTSQEMFGHVGIPSRTSCFPQCIWLPRWLGIELYNENHALHHRNPAVNFGKRFSLWDKVFKTFRSS